MAVAPAAADLATQAKAFYWYHCIDLGGGVVTDGDYAMTAYLKHYALPGTMAGREVPTDGAAPCDPGPPPRQTSVQTPPRATGRLSGP